MVERRGVETVAGVEGERKGRGRGEEGDRKGRGRGEEGGGFIDGRPGRKERKGRSGRYSE